MLNPRMISFTWTNMMPCLQDLVSVLSDTVDIRMHREMWWIDGWMDGWLDRYDGWVDY